MKNQASVHDNIVIGYEVNGSDKTIRLKTETSEGELSRRIDVLFNDVLAYDFENDSFDSILYGVSETDITPFVDEHLAEFQLGWNNKGWPGEWCLNREKAIEFLINRNIKAFEVASSIGLTGWVLARELKTIEVPPPITGLTFDSVVFETQDLKLIRSFYEDILEFKVGFYEKNGKTVEDSSENYVNYRVEGGIVGFERSHTSPTPSDLVLKCCDFAEYKNRIQSKGVNFEKDTPAFFIIQDPEKRKLIFEPADPHSKSP